MPFALALAVSALLHAAAITAPGWDLPGAAEAEATALDAHLLPPPKPAPPPEKPKPRAASPRKAPPVAATAAIAANAATPPMTAPALAIPAVAVPMPPEAPPAVAPVEAPAAAAEPTPALPPSPPWPRQGRVRYTVVYGDGFVIGETTHEWRVDGERYSIRSIAEPKGLAAMFGKLRAQASVGEITAAGLRPSEFRDRREGRAEETASFDWPAGRAVFSGGRGEAVLAPGTQDLVSVFYQLAWLAPRRDIEFAVATGSRVGRWTFEWVGEETLDLKTGPLSTLHLRTRADGDVTEVWLAPAHGGLPVKIRHIDRKGDVFEQAADLLELN